jgi:hypothetical protein
MDGKLIEVEDLKSVLKTVGIRPEEYGRCVGWTSPELDKPLTAKDIVLAELTQEEQGFIRCMGFAYEQKVVDSLRSKALHEIFWSGVKSQHDLPLDGLTVKEGKYVVVMQRESAGSLSCLLDVIRS